MSSNFLRFGSSVVIFTFMLNVLPALGQVADKDRAGIDEKYKWNLEDIYPSMEAWQKDKDGLKERMKEISAFLVPRLAYTLYDILATPPGKPALAIPGRL